MRGSLFQWGDGGEALKGQSLLNYYRVVTHFVAGEFLTKKRKKKKIGLLVKFPSAGELYTMSMEKKSEARERER